MHTNAARFQRITAGTYLEGLAVDHERDVIWYSDPVAGGVHGVKPDGTLVASFNTDRKWTGGVHLNADGCVLSTGPRGIMWNDPDTGESGWLLEDFDGEPIAGINEVAPDGLGGVFFGTIDIEMIALGQPTSPSTLYRLTADREVVKMVDGIGFANGLMYDPSRRILYCNDTFHCTWAFDLDESRRLKNRRRLVEKEDVDGMALDAAGNVWITGFHSNVITRVAPDGALLPPVETPAEAITQIRFGGPDMRDYYFTSVPGDGADTLKEGGALAQMDSMLWRGRSDNPGMRLASSRFALH